MDEIYYITQSNWKIFLDNLKRTYRVFLPQPSGSEDYLYQEAKDSENFVFNAYRCVEPVKSFLAPAKEEITELVPEKPIAIVGLKNCDLHSLRVQDFVYEQDGEVDPFYHLRREKAVLISGDCTDYKDVCFCLALGVLPFGQAGFDLNLSCLNEGYLVQIGSQKGKNLITPYLEYFVTAKESQISSRTVKRENLKERLNKNLFSQNLPAKEILQSIVKNGYNAATWQNFMLTCVECGACNFICCTCHCFLLADTENNAPQRLRMWDSCQYANFARVAGGVNPLRRRSQRLRNRFLKKFDFFVDNLGEPACEGCGRCIEACPGKIDIREVLKDLAKNA